MKTTLCVTCWLLVATLSRAQGQIEIVLDDQRIRRFLIEGSSKERLFAAEQAATRCQSARNISNDLVDALRDTDPRVRRAAARALGAIGPSAYSRIPELAEALGDTDLDVCCTVADALAQIGPMAAAAIPALIRSLADEDINLRMHAATALALIGPAAKDSVPHLIEAFQHAPMTGQGDADLASNIAFALNRIGPAAAEAVPILLDELRTGDPKRVHHALVALGGIGPVRPEVLPAVLATLRHSNPLIWGSAVFALTQGGCWGKEPIPLLMERLRLAEKFGRESPEGKNLSSVLGALEKLGPTKEPVTEVSILVNNAKAPYELRRRAVITLRFFSKESPEAVAALIAILREQSPRDMVSYATNELVRVGSPAVPSLIELLEKGERKTRHDTVTVLRYMRLPARPALTALKKLAADPSGDWKQTVGDAIREIEAAPVPRWQRQTAPAPPAPVPSSQRPAK